MYRPQKIAQQHFLLKNKTVAGVYEVERDIIQLDERIKYSPFASAIRKTVLRGDALASFNVDKIYPDIYSVFRVEAAGFLLSQSEDSNEAIKESLKKERLATFDSALATYRYMQTTEWISNKQNKIQIETPEDMLRLYARSIGGENAKTEDLGFRSELLRPSDIEENTATYEPPHPDNLNEFLQDFCDFINKDTLSPISQSSIAQFQFEALRPFDLNLDRMERLLMSYILSRRRLVENIALPLNFFSAHVKDRFYQLLKPYLTQEEDLETIIYVEELLLYMTKVASELIQLTFSLHKMIAILIEQWKTRLGRVEKGSALELLLYEFAGTPIMTISQGLNLVHKSFSTTSEAFDRLESAGILRIGKSIRRNKTFEAIEALQFHNRLYSSRATTLEGMPS